MKGMIEYMEKKFEKYRADENNSKWENIIRILSYY